MAESVQVGDLFAGDSADATPAREASPIASTSKSGGGSPNGHQAEPLIKDEEADLGDDLFGDDDDDDDVKGATPRTDRGRSSTGTPATRLSTRSPERNRLEYGEEEGDEERDETWANIALPQWEHMQPTDGKVWHMKLPAYVNIEAKPYDVQLYRETLEEAEDKDDVLAAKSKMIGVRNTIRWRWVTGPDGEPMRQSNARMLRWSDGSVSMQLGSDLYDVAPSHGTTLARPEDPKPTGKNQQLEAPSTQSNTTFLCIPAPTEKVLVSEAALAGQLSLLPTSMNSKTHMELVKHVGQQHVKHSRMKILEDIQDPEKVNALLALAGGGGNQKPAANKSGKARATPRKQVKAKTHDYDSESDRDDPSPKRKGKGSRRTYDDDEDEDDDDGFVVADDDDDEGVAVEEDSDDMAYGSSKKSKGKKGKKSKKRKDSESMDELEAMDKRMEERERERKRVKREKEAAAGGGGEGGKSKAKKSKEIIESEDEEDEDAEGEDAEGEEDMDMDVESEDE
ncbi:RNA polymerase-associated protein LEO1, partial [Tremellales sp. Uapishka_1]